LEVAPTAPLTAEELKVQETKRRKRRVRIGVGVSFAVVAIAGAVTAGAMAASISRGFDDW
jgi:hypothetical protein